MQYIFREPASEYANFPLRGSKGSVYEGGTKVGNLVDMRETVNKMYILSGDVR